MKKIFFLIVFLTLLQGEAYAQYEIITQHNKPTKVTALKDTTYSEFVYMINSFPRWAEKLCNKEQRQYLDSLFTMCSSVDCQQLVMCLTHPSMIEDVIQTTRRFFPLSHYAGQSVQLMSSIQQISPVIKKQCFHNQYVIYKGFDNPEVKVLLNVYYTLGDNQLVEISHYDVVAVGPKGTNPKLKRGKWPHGSENNMKLFCDGTFGGTIIQTLIYTNSEGAGIKEMVHFNFNTDLLEK